MVRRGRWDRFVDWNPPDDPVAGTAIATDTGLYPLDASTRGALGIAGSRLDDLTESGQHYAEEAQARWDEEHGWQRYRYLDTGEYLRYDGLVVPSVWQDEIATGEWPVDGYEAHPPWPPPPGTPCLAEAIGELNEERERLGLRPVTAHRLSREQLDLLWEARQHPPEAER